MAEERKDYAVLISLATREEAEVAAAALRADGVDAFVGNRNHAAADWFYVLALGGAQILVPHRRLADAKLLLRERIRENADAEPAEVARRRDHWKLWLIGAWVYAPITLAWLVYLLPVPWPSWAWIPDVAWMIRDGFE